MKKNNSSFTNSELGRTKPRRRIFHSFINDKLKRHRSDTGLVEDRTSSTTIVRIIIGLLLLHLVIIGGVLLKGHFEKGAGGMAVAAPTLTPPPSVAQPARPQDELLPQPTAASSQRTAAATGNHITQPVVDEDSAEEIFPDEGAVAATPAPTPTAPAVAPRQDSAPAPVETPAPAAGMTTVKHLVASGETWYSVARKYDTTVAALKAANPAAARREYLYQGNYIVVPVKADSAAAREAVATAPPAPAPKVHVVKRGETLGAIARKHKMTTARLMKLNNLTEKDARRIQVGQELRVSE